MQVTAMTLPAVVLTHPLHPAVQQAYAAQADFVVAPATDADTLRGCCRDADAIIVRAPLPEDIFASARRLRAAVRHGAGLDMIPLEAATRAHVPVANAPAVNARSVAEHCIGQMVALARRHPRVQRAVAERDWLEARSFAEHGLELFERTVGIVGVGNVGATIAGICRHGLGMEVLGTGPQQQSYPETVVYADLDELLARSDFVVLCCPLTPQTRGLIGAPQLARMKRSACLINVARGPVVAEAALLAALSAGTIAGAALDVFVEQPLPRDHPFWQTERLIVTPHMAGITDASMRKMGELALSQALQILRGERPRYLVNPEIWDRRRH